MEVNLCCFDGFMPNHSAMTERFNTVLQVHGRVSEYMWGDAFVLTRDTLVAPRPRAWPRDTRPITAEWFAPALGKTTRWAGRRALATSCGAPQTASLRNGVQRSLRPLPASHVGPGS